VCGRFADYFETERLVEEFQVQRVIEPPGPSYNVAPTARIGLVREVPAEAGLARELRGARWGLVLSWSKDPAAGPRLINARSETVTVKPSFRAAARARRGLIPAAGYFEWRANPAGPKTPYFLHPADARPLAMAALYEWWWPPAPAQPPDAAYPADGPHSADAARAAGPAIAADAVALAAGAEPLLSATVITRAATDATGWVHDRMPLIVPREAWAAWLDPDLRDPAAVQSLIASLPDPELLPRRVGRAVGSVKNNGPHLIAPA
jgi:putative SOS response-associated peptidase YedK